MVIVLNGFFKKNVYYKMLYCSDKIPWVAYSLYILQVLGGTRID